MDWPEFAVRWTIRVSLTLYVAALVLRVHASGRPARISHARAVWTAGYGCFLLHLATAFHFVHGWSHTAAYEATARQSQAIVGLAWGGGVFANYVFAVVWGADVLWWWLWPVGYENRSKAIEWTLQGFLGFIAFNSTAVFGQGVIRWVGWAAVAILAIAYRFRYRS